MADVKTVRLSDIMKVVKSTSAQYHTFEKDFIAYIRNCIVSGDIGMPTIEYCSQNFASFKDYMIKVYHSIYDSTKGIEDIPDWVKVAQGCLYDGLMYGYDANTSELKGIFTLNPAVIGEDLYDKAIKKVFKKNQVAELFGYRIDFDVLDYTEGIYDMKMVNHRTVIDEENVCLVPYIAGDVICSTVHKLLSNDGMIAFKQTLPNGSIKVRGTSLNTKHLAHYCDDPLAVEGLTAEYMPIQGCMYVPSLGAPSTTAMMTRIDFINLDRIVKLGGYEDCRRLGIQKSRDGVGELFKEQSIILSLADMKVNNPDEFFRTVSKLPNAGILEGVNPEEIGVSTVANYLHTSTRGIENRALKVVKGATERYEVRKSLVSIEPYSVTWASLYDELKNHLVKVIWKKPNGKYSSAVCTNSSDILRKVYGTDYFGKYESFGVRASALASRIGDIPSKEELSSVLLMYGFKPEIAEGILSQMRQGNDFEGSLYNCLGKVKREKSNEFSTITARTLEGYLVAEDEESGSELKSVGYYTSIDLNRLIRAIVIA